MMRKTMMIVTFVMVAGCAAEMETPSERSYRNRIMDMAEEQCRERGGVLAVRRPTSSPTMATYECAPKPNPNLLRNF